MNKEMKEYLESLLEDWEKPDEDFNPMDNSGGNFDDCYYMGQEDGKCFLAKKLIAKWGNSND